MIPFSFNDFSDRYLYSMIALFLASSSLLSTLLCLPSPGILAGPLSVIFVGYRIACCSFLGRVRSGAWCAWSPSRQACRLFFRGRGQLKIFDINRLNIRYGRFEIFLLSLPLRELDSRLSITESMSRENRVEAMILDEGKLHHVLFCLRI